MSGYKISKELFDKIENLVLNLGYLFYYVEYVKEQNDNYLRVYIDNENGIALDDCTKVSKQVSILLDELDPINESYYLEVSSPGIERVLFNNKHLEMYTGNDVTIKLSKIFNGKKTFEGELLSFDEESISIKSKGSKVSIPRERIKKIVLKVEF
ncbi:ribosome maturation factor RimP [Clostridium sediminicola]|uniref:ribosome maturation factor RimP n=1 Tax=Clostridium sediminicola TaxID=3114879 RepID=UPI0031F27558